MTAQEAITMLRRIQEPEPFEPQINEAAFEALQMAIEALESKYTNHCSDCQEFDCYGCKYKEQKHDKQRSDKAIEKHGNHV